jgi:hypothetical protein
MSDDLKGARLSWNQGMALFNFEHGAEAAGSFMDELTRRNAPAHGLGANLEVLLPKASQKALDEWLTEVVKAEVERVKREGGPMRHYARGGHWSDFEEAIGADEDPDVILEYLGGYVDSVEHMGGSIISVGMKFKDKVRWLLNPRSGAWICIDPWVYWWTF